VWSVMLYAYLNALQTFLVFLVVAFVGPGLIAADLRHQAHEIYFARPVGWWDYIAGKFAVVAVFVGAVTLVPACVLYVESILVSPSIASLWHTIHLVPRLGLIWIVWAAATGLPMLALSSLGPGSRLTAFLWVAGWIGSQVLSWVIHGVSFGAAMAARADLPRGARGPRPDWGDPHWSSVLSYHDNLLAVAYGILGVEDATAPYQDVLARAETLRNQTPGHSPWVAFGVLAGVCLLSLLVLRLRVRPQGAA